MVAATTQRVSQNTPKQFNQRIHKQTEMNIAYYEKHPEEIRERLQELEREWDIERFLETGSSVVTLGGVLMSILRGRKYLIFPLAVQAFMLQHAVEGWCPPLPVLRGLGVRTTDEINQERQALREFAGNGKKK